jgi:hypothetical protein
MKFFVTNIFIFLSLISSAQKIEKFFDYKWKECKPNAASFYEVIMKTDSGWHCQDFFISGQHLQMDGTYEDSSRNMANGMFYYFYANKQPQTIGRYVHGKKEGVWLQFHPNGMMSDSAFFENGKSLGTSISWYSNGMIRDSSVWQKDGSGVVMKWFENGYISFAGRYIKWKVPQGKWQFFHNNGKASDMEIYNDGVLSDKKYFDESGKITDTVNHDRKAIFPGGIAAWDKWLSRQLYFPKQYRIVNSNEAVVVVTFVVTEDGKVTEVNVKTPFEPEIDKIAVNAIKKSPKWDPEIEHNRSVKSYHQQAVTFSQH